MLAPSGTSEQAELQGQVVRGRGVADYATARCDVLGVEGLSDPLCQLQVAGFIIGPAEQARYLAEYLGRASEVGGGDHVRVGEPCPRLVRGCARVEPVAELEAPIPQSPFAREGGDEVNPRTHALELGGQDARLAVALVEYPRDDHRGITPGGRRDRRQRQDVGNDEGNDSRGSLLGGKVRQPRGEEAGGVVEEAGRGRECQDVAGPAQALVTLRAI